MKAERTKKVNNHVVEEFYWAGKIVVYVDNNLVSESFEEVVKKLENKEDI